MKEIPSKVLNRAHQLVHETKLYIRKSAVPLARCHPTLSLNLACLLGVLIYSYWTYSGYLMGFGDALWLYAPYVGHSLRESILFHFFNTQAGALVSIAIWGGFQRLNYLLGISDPLQYPWWLLVAIAQFSLFCSPINLAIYLKRTLGVPKLPAFLIYFSFISIWSLHPAFFGFALNPGQGMYPIGIYLFSVALVVLTAKSTPLRTFAKYLAFIVVLNHADPVKVPMLLFFLYHECVVRGEKLAAPKDYIARAAPAVVIFLATSAVSVFAPGFQKRMESFHASGLLPTGISDVIQSIPRSLSYSIINTYPYVFGGGENEAAVGIYYLLHAILSVFSLILFAILLCRYFREKKLAGQNRPPENLTLRYSLLIPVALASLHGTFVRTLLVPYHSSYANDNPTFFLLSFLTVLILSVSFMLQPKRPTQEISMGLWSAILLVAFLLPNGFSSAREIRWAHVKGTATAEAYKQVLKVTEAGKNSTGGPSPPAQIVKLIGAPWFSPYNESPAGGDLNLMLKWRNIPNVEVMASGYFAFRPEAEGKEVRVAVPPVLPVNAFFHRFDVPQLARTIFFHGEAVRDYWIPLQIKNHCTMEIMAYPNLEGGRYQSHFRFLVSFALGHGGPATPFALNVQSVLLSSTEGLDTPRIQPSSFSVGWVQGDKEVPFIPDNAPNRILRLRIKAGSPKYTYTSSVVRFSNCR